MRPAAIILVAISLVGCGADGEAPSAFEPPDPAELGAVLREACHNDTGPTTLERIKGFERVQDGLLRLEYWASSSQPPCAVALYPVEGAYATAVLVGNPAIQLSDLRAWCIDVEDAPPSVGIEGRSVFDAVKGRTVKAREFPVGELKCERVPVVDVFGPNM